jgi:N-acetylneuraminic acid mutarotase
MVVWRNFLVLFGGFYEAMREVRWYNDLYIFSFQDQRWVSIPHKANMQAPKPRSGVQMCAHAQDDVIYIYGGYSKEKVTGSKKEGKVHEDMWCLNLKPMLAAAGAVTAGRAGGVGSIDTSKATWQKITRKGDFPTARCGAGMTMYKNKALLFGGVFDDEGEGCFVDICDFVICILIVFFIRLNI